MDEVPRRSSLSKATIYKHWPGALALAVGTYGHLATATVLTGGSGRIGDILADQVVRLGRFSVSG